MVLYDVGVGVLASVNVKNLVSCVVTTCSWKESRRFEGTDDPHLRGGRVRRAGKQETIADKRNFASSLVCLSTLKIEAMCFPVTSVFLLNTCR